MGAPLWWNTGEHRPLPGVDVRPGREGGPGKPQGQRERVPHELEASGLATESLEAAEVYLQMTGGFATVYVFTQTVRVRAGYQTFRSRNPPDCWL